MKIPQVKFYNGYPVLTSEKAKYVDRIAVLDYGITEDILMENAGKAAAFEIEKYIEEIFKKEIKNSNISVLCGRGNNGGDGLVCARYLKDKGADVSVFIAAPSDKGYSRVVVENLNKAKNMGIPISLISFENIEEVSLKLKDTDVIVDALLGIGAIGKPTGIIKKMIQFAMKTKKDIISLDIPSGLNPDTGHHTGVFISAKMTITFGFPKSGLMAPHAQKNIGKLIVVDIGYPQQLVEKVLKENQS